MADSEAIAGMRRDLGRQLAAKRNEAGLMQRELGVLMGYSRTAIANAETAATRLGRPFWERADRALGTGETLARGYDRIQAQITAEAQAGDLRQMTAGTSHQSASETQPPQPLTVELAMRGYQERGWPVVQGPGQELWLVTGTAIDALEVPRQAGMVAMGWWLYTRGVPDEIRGLPVLPDPAVALAMITAGSSCYFLTQPGLCPWTRRDIATARLSGPDRPPLVRWHADGGRVPAPPSPLGNGEQASWAHIPSGDGRQLVSPMALLHVLALATAAASRDAELSLPGGVRLVPGTAPHP